MKYLKTFEDNEEKYKVGDYILLTNLGWSGWKEEVLKYAKITKIINTRINKTYDVQVYLLKQDKSIDNYHLTIGMIARKLKTYEIEEFKLKITANQFNI